MTFYSNKIAKNKLIILFVKNGFSNQIKNFYYNFFKSGWLKLQNFFNDDWESTRLLFEEIHPPILRPEVMSFFGLSGDPIQILPVGFAAAAGTLTEVIFAILLIFGLMGRLGALGLLIATAVIQLTFEDNVQHYFWAFLLAMFFLRGPGIISADFFIRKWAERRIS